MLCIYVVPYVNMIMCGFYGGLMVIEHIVLWIE